MNTTWVLTILVALLGFVAVVLLARLVLRLVVRSTVVEDIEAELETDET